jgi:hypothetical protein
MTLKEEVQEDHLLEVLKTFINLTCGHQEKKLVLLKIISKSLIYGKMTPKAKQKNN